MHFLNLNNKIKILNKHNKNKKQKNLILSKIEFRKTFTAIWIPGSVRP